MPDGLLIHTAVHEAGDLIPAAVAVLYEELRKRNLAESLGAAVAAQTRDWTPQEVEALVQQARQCPCPICGGTDWPLNVFRIVTVTGFFFFTVKKDQLLLGCPDCILRAAQKASRWCWLALLHSPFWAISVGRVNAKAKRAHKVTEPTKEFAEYVLQNRGAIVLALQKRAVTAQSAPLGLS